MRTPRHSTGRSFCGAAKKQRAGAIAPPVVSARDKRPRFNPPAEGAVEAGAAVEEAAVEGAGAGAGIRPTGPR